MMRKVLTVGAGLVVATNADTGSCVLNGAQAVSDMTDAAIYTWAATQRCSKGGNYAVKCEVDVAQAVESTNKMVNLIVKTVNNCGALNSVNKECGMAASSLTAQFAGLGAAAGQVVQQCPNPTATKNAYVSEDALRGAGKSVGDPAWQDGLAATCTVDIKDSVASLFKAGAAVAAAKQACSGDDESTCAYNALGIVDALGSLGRYLMGSVGHCTRPGKQLPANYPIGCSEAVTNLITHSTGFAGAATKVSVKCAPKPPPPPPATPAPTPAPAPVEDISVTETQPMLAGSAVPEGPPTVTASYNIEGDGQGPSPDAPQGTPTQDTLADLREEVAEGEQPGEIPANPPAERLYGEDIVKSARRWQKAVTEERAPSSNFLNMGLTAMLPITAVVAFVGGMKLRRQQATYTEVTREVGLDI